MRKINVLTKAIMFALAGVLHAPPVTAAEVPASGEQKPNIVFILMDNLG